MVASAVRTLVCLLVLAHVSGSVAQNNDPQSPASSEAATKTLVDQAAGDYFKASPHAVGISIGILNDGKAYTYSYGSAVRGGAAPAADSLYPIASITKTFTGTLLAQAALEKKLSLSDDVRKYMDGQYPNLEYQGHPIRIEQLVNHLSGLPFNLPDIAENRPPFPTVPAAVQVRLDQYTRAKFLADLHDVKLDRVPGEKFSYSNAAAILASIILERIYGMPYEEIVKKKITGPLHMADTTISLSHSQRGRLVKGYDEKGQVVPYPDAMQLGAAGLKSTVADMLQYARWELAEKDEAVKLSHKPTFTYNNYSAGLNWQMLTTANHRRIWQEGNLPGFVSMCTTFPELNVAVVVLANEDDPASSHALTLMTKAIAKGLDARTAPLW